jgi:hypothetical protein
LTEERRHCSLIPKRLIVIIHFFQYTNLKICGRGNLSFYNSSKFLTLLLSIEIDNPSTAFLMIKADLETSISYKTYLSMEGSDILDLTTIISNNLLDLLKELGKFDDPECKTLLSPVSSMQKLVACSLLHDRLELHLRVWRCNDITEQLSRRVYHLQNKYPGIIRRFYLYWYPVDDLSELLSRIKTYSNDVISTINGITGSDQSESPTPCKTLTTTDKIRLEVEKLRLFIDNRIITETICLSIYNDTKSCARIPCKKYDVDADGYIKHNYVSKAERLDTESIGQITGAMEKYPDSEPVCKALTSIINLLSTDFYQESDLSYHRTRLLKLLAQPIKVECTKIPERPEKSGDIDEDPTIMTSSLHGHRNSWVFIETRQKCFGYSTVISMIRCLKRLARCENFNGDSRFSEGGGYIDAFHNNNNKCCCKYDNMELIAEYEGIENILHLNKRLTNSDILNESLEILGYYFISKICPDKILDLRTTELRKILGLVAQVTQILDLPEKKVCVEGIYEFDRFKETVKQPNDNRIKILRRIIEEVRIYIDALISSGPTILDNKDAEDAQANYTTRWIIEHQQRAYYQRLKVDPFFEGTTDLVDNNNQAFRSVGVASGRRFGRPGRATRM